MTAHGWRKRQTMQWIPSEKKKPATELSMESLEEMVEELKGLKDRGIAIAIKPTKVMFRPLDFENKRRDEAFADFIGGVAYEEDRGWTKEVWDAAWSARRDEAIAEAEQQEPVAWELRKGKTDRVLLEITNDPKRAHDWNCSLEEVVPLYTHPPKQWQGLTDEDIQELHYQIKVQWTGTYRTEDIYRAIEAKLREKNG